MYSDIHLLLEAVGWLRYRAPSVRNSIFIHHSLTYSLSPFLQDISLCSKCPIVPTEHKVTDAIRVPVCELCKVTIETSVMLKVIWHLVWRNRMANWRTVTKSPENKVQNKNPVVNHLWARWNDYSPLLDDLFGILDHNQIRTKQRSHAFASSNARTTVKCSTHELHNSTYS